ncbi:hypothetical protein QTO02_10480, partial [Vibrio fortis]
WLLQRMSVVDFTFGGIANPVAGIVMGMLLMGESFTAAQYSLMTGMIVMSVTHFDSRNFMGLLWVIGLNTALGYGMYVWLLQRMSVVDFTFGGIANPVAGIVMGMLLMGESFTAAQYSLMTGMIVMSPVSHGFYLFVLFTIQSFNLSYLNRRLMIKEYT